MDIELYILDRQLTNVSNAIRVMLDSTSTDLVDWSEKYITLLEYANHLESRIKSLGGR